MFPLNDRRRTCPSVLAEGEGRCSVSGTFGADVRAWRAEKFAPKSKKDEEKLSITGADVSLLTTLGEESREQLNAIFAELKKMRSRLEMGEDRLTTLYDAQTKVATVMGQLRTQTADKSSESVEVQSAAIKSE